MLGSGLSPVPAVMPPSCVHASMGDPAWVLVHHVREQKAGPQIPVTVVQCRTHRRAFTLYPLGHIPCGRLAVAPVTLDGQVVLSTESEPTAGDHRHGAPRSSERRFAAIDDPTIKLTIGDGGRLRHRSGWPRAPRCWACTRGSREPEADAIAFPA